MIPQLLQAARLKLIFEHPYLASAVFSLTPVKCPGLGTLAVDQYWRLYYDPEFVEGLSLEYLVAILYHEVLHLLRNHPERFRLLDPKIANLATDMEINDDIKEEVRLPSNAVFPKTFGLPEKRTAEEYFDKLLEIFKEKEAGGEGKTSGIEEGKGREAGGKEKTSGIEEGRGKEAGGEGKTSGIEEEKEEKAGGEGKASGIEKEKEEKAGGEGKASGIEKEKEEKAGGEGKASGIEEGKGREAGGKEKPSDIEGGKVPRTFEPPRPGEGHCGSCAHGHPQPWELPPQFEDAPGLDKETAEMIRRVVARRIIEESKTRGTVPAHLARWAREKLSPKIDWRKELATLFRRAFHTVYGDVDYSYRKLSRRQSPYSKIILPAFVKQIPSIVVIVDTSGSIGDRQLELAIGTIRKLLREVGITGITVLSCDAVVHTVEKIFSADKITLVGGGGTDMRVGIEKALQLRPKPELVIVITDGYTPWPDNPPKGVRIIVVLVGDGKTPDWARVIKVET